MPCVLSHAGFPRQNVRARECSVCLRNVKHHAWFLGCWGCGLICYGAMFVARVVQCVVWLLRLKGVQDQECAAGDFGSVACAITCGGRLRFVVRVVCRGECEVPVCQRRAERAEPGRDGAPRGEATAGGRWRREVSEAFARIAMPVQAKPDCRVRCEVCEALTPHDALGTLGSTSLGSECGLGSMGGGEPRRKMCRRSGAACWGGAEGAVRTLRYARRPGGTGGDPLQWEMTARVCRARGAGWPGWWRITLRGAVCMCRGLCFLSLET